jgi:hypothetical protein
MKSRILTLLTAMALFAVPAIPVQGSARVSHNNITTFDVPGAGTGAGQGTIPSGMNPWNAITGWYIDANNVNHGFVRSPNGSFTTFDPQGSIYTNAYGLNEGGRSRDPTLTRTA